MNFIDLKRQRDCMAGELDEAIRTVVDHCQFIMGPEVVRAEEALAQFTGVRHVLTCASGTDALLLALMAWGVGPGDAVFTSPFTFVATAEAIALLGATPVFVDICPKTFNLDPAKLRIEVERTAARKALRPAGIIPVDLFGLPADYDAIMPLAEEFGLFVLEDAAQGFGGQYHGRQACGLGHVGATSFFPAKPLGCYGDGGAVFTDRDDLVEIMRSIRIHGQGGDRYENVRVGLNARFDTIQAAVLLVKLAAFPEELEARQQVAFRYTKGLTGWVETPVVPEGLTSAWAQYSVLTDRRDEVLSRMNQAGVPTAVYYPIPLHRQKAFASLGYETDDFPEAEKAAARIFSLPMHPYLTDKELDLVINAVRGAVDQTMV